MLTRHPARSEFFSAGYATRRTAGSPRSIPSISSERAAASITSDSDRTNVGLRLPCIFTRSAVMSRTAPARSTCTVTRPRSTGIPPAVASKVRCVAETLSRRRTSGRVSAAPSEMSRAVERSAARALSTGIPTVSGRMWPRNVVRSGRLSCVSTRHTVPPATAVRTDGLEAHQADGVVLISTPNATAVTTAILIATLTLTLSRRERKPEREGTDFMLHTSHFTLPASHFALRPDTLARFRGALRERG